MAANYSIVESDGMFRVTRSDGVVIGSHSIDEDAEHQMAQMEKRNAREVDTTLADIVPSEK